MSRRKYKVIVAGSRTASGAYIYSLLERKLDAILKHKAVTHDIVIVSGKARGADQLGEQYAMSRSFQIESYPAEWDQYGKRAGYIRNEQMAQNADALVALWDGQSRGTKHMIDIAGQHFLPTRIISLNE